MKIEDLTKEQLEQFKFYLRAEGVPFIINEEAIDYDEITINGFKYYISKPLVSSNPSKVERLNNSSPGDILLFEWKSYYNDAFDYNKMGDNVINISNFTGIFSDSGFHPSYMKYIFSTTSIGSSRGVGYSKYFPATLSKQISFYIYNFNKTYYLSSLKKYFDNWAKDNYNPNIKGCNFQWELGVYCNNGRLSSVLAPAFSIYFIKSNRNHIFNFDPKGFLNPEIEINDNQIIKEHRIYALGTAFEDSYTELGDKRDYRFPVMNNAFYSLYNQVINLNEYKVLIEEFKDKIFYVRSFLIGESQEDALKRFKEMLEARLIQTRDMYKRLVENKKDYDYLEPMDKFKGIYKKGKRIKTWDHNIWINTFKHMFKDNDRSEAYNNALLKVVEETSAPYLEEIRLMITII